RVDITLVTKNNGKSSCKTILQHVLVMAVDAQAERSTEQKHLIGQTITVAATPQEAGRLSLAGSLGELQLQLKGAGESALISPVTITEADLERPITPTPEKPTDVASADIATVSTIKLPALPPEEKKEEEKKEAPKAREIVKAKVPEKTAVEEEKPAPKRNF